MSFERVLNGAFQSDLCMPPLAGQRTPTGAIKQSTNSINSVPVLPLNEPISTAQQNTSQKCCRRVRDPGLPASNPTKSYRQTRGKERLLNAHSTGLPEKRDVVVLGSEITGAVFQRL